MDLQAEYTVALREWKRCVREKNFEWSRIYATEIFCLRKMAAKRGIKLSVLGDKK